MKGIKVLLSSKSIEWATPQDFFDKLNSEFHFTLDPCANETNAKCDKYYTRIEDELLTPCWGGVDSILPSSLWSRTWRVGAQVQDGELETQY